MIALEAASVPRIWRRRAFASSRSSPMRRRSLPRSPNAVSIFWSRGEAPVPVLAVGPRHEFRQGQAVPVLEKITLRPGDIRFESPA